MAVDDLTWTEPAAPVGTATVTPPSPAIVLPASTTRAQSVLLYDPLNIDNVLSQMAPDEIDRLPFGVIKVDRKGKILVYNAAEGMISGRDPSRVVGRNFFREIAPCTNRAEFLGRFVEGLKTGKLDAQFKYLFDFRMRPTMVSVHLRSSYDDENVWIVIQAENLPVSAGPPARP